MSQVDYQPEIKAKRFYISICQGYRLRARYLHAVPYFHYAGTLVTKCVAIICFLNCVHSYQLCTYAVCIKIYDPYTVSQVDYQPEIKSKTFLHLYMSRIPTACSVPARCSIFSLIGHSCDKIGYMFRDFR